MPSEARLRSLNAILKTIQEAFKQGNNTGELSLKNIVLHHVNQKGSENSLLNWQFISKCSEAMLPITSTKSKWESCHVFLLPLTLWGTWNKILEPYYFSTSVRKNRQQEDTKETAIKEQKLSLQLGFVYNNSVPVIGKAHLLGITTQFKWKQSLGREIKSATENSS